MYRHKRGLVALDGSSSSETVLQLLMEIAGSLDMTMPLLMVVEGTRYFVVDHVEARRRESPRPCGRRQKTPSGLTTSQSAVRSTRKGHRPILASVPRHDLDDGDSPRRMTRHADHPFAFPGDGCAGEA